MCVYWTQGKFKSSYGIKNLSSFWLSQSVQHCLPWLLNCGKPSKIILVWYNMIYLFWISGWMHNARFDTAEAHLENQYMLHHSTGKQQDKHRHRSLSLQATVLRICSPGFSLVAPVHCHPSKNQWPQRRTLLISLRGLYDTFQARLQVPPWHLLDRTKNDGKTTFLIFFHTRKPNLEGKKNDEKWLCWAWLQCKVVPSLVVMLKMPQHLKSHILVMKPIFLLPQGFQVSILIRLCIFPLGARKEVSCLLENAASSLIEE